MACTAVLFCSLLCYGSLAALVHSASCDDRVPSMPHAAISNKQVGGYLVDTTGAIKFRKELGYPETLWNLKFAKGGLIIARNAGGKDGKLLGVDPNTKRLTYFDEPGETTTWKFNLVRPAEIRPPRPFEAILFMEIGDEELRLSADDDGIPIMGAKGHILSFLMESG